MTGQFAGRYDSLTREQHNRRPEEEPGEPGRKNLPPMTGHGVGPFPCFGQRSGPGRKPGRNPSIQKQDNLNIDVIQRVDS